MRVGCGSVLGRERCSLPRESEGVSIDLSAPQALPAGPADPACGRGGRTDPHNERDARVSTASLIAEECDAVRDLLLAKNRAYGDSALDPVRIFCRADPAEQLRVRIDDKLSRLARGHAAGEDVVLDLIGYLVLLRIAMRTQPTTEQGQP